MRLLELEAEYMELIKSDRVSAVTRAVLLKRAAPDDPGYSPKAISVNQLTTLRALLAQVIPQGFGAASVGSEPFIDIAARLDKQLATGVGDGWRYANQPNDAEAYRLGLNELNNMAQKDYQQSFASLHAAAQIELLGAIANGTRTSEEGKVDMMRWFEEVRGNAVEIYVSHPATLARLGYSGIADGGDSATMQGFTQIRMGEVEPWEPKPALPAGAGGDQEVRRAG